MIPDDQQQVRGEEPGTNEYQRPADCGTDRREPEQLWGDQKASAGDDAGEISGRETVVETQHDGACCSPAPRHRATGTSVELACL